MSSTSLGGYLIHSICAIFSIHHNANTLELLIDEIRNRIEEVMNNANKKISQNVLFTSNYIPGTVLFGSNGDKTNTLKYKPQLDDIKESNNEDENDNNNTVKSDTKTSIEHIVNQIKRNVVRNVHQSVHSSQST